ncbi:MAG: hydrogenase iron-sulfur subunit [Anaerolineales bacterium]|nr:hydrogenase iron-sulfur subunit [Anaerolineales bacterium]
MSHEGPPTFAERVRAIPGGEHLEMCYACGTCVSKCLIQQKVEPEYNPRRLLRLVMMGREADAYRSPTTWLCSQCDLCYPACPQQIHISGVIAAVRQLALEAGYASPLEAVSVDETLCSGCGICVMACPYWAPRLVEKEVDGQLDRFAEVNANVCMGCGICVSACPLGAISRPGVSNQEIVAQIEVEEANGAPTLVVFVCDWCLRETDDVALLEAYPSNVRVIHIPCSGRADPQMALLALRAGIDGVLVCGCAPGECHFVRGTYVSSCKIGLLNRMFEQMAIDDGRVRFVQIGTQDRGRIRHEVDVMLQALAARKEERS